MYGTKLAGLSYLNCERPDTMKTFKVSLIASGIGTAAGLGAWAFGLTRIVWPAHPQLAGFLLTIVTTIVVQSTWPTESESR